MNKKSFICFLIIAQTCVLIAQEIKPHGKFIQDSMVVGQPISFELQVTYPTSFTALFPDSTYDFAPFEWVSKTYKPSRIDSTWIMDKTTYQIRSFELDSLQALKLPVFLVDQSGDSTTIFTPLDTIRLVAKIKTLPQKIELKESTDLFKIAYRLPYFYITIFAVALVFILLTCWLIFRKSIQRTIKIRRLTKRHLQFMEQYRTLRLNILTNELKGQRTPDQTLELYNLWKSYMEGLEHIPYTKLTSKELLKISDNQMLIEIIRTIEKDIYSRVKNKKLYKSFEQLQKITVERFYTIIDQIKFKQA